MIKVLFYIVLALPGQQPQEYREPMETWEMCLEHQRIFLEAGPPAGGVLQTSCVLIDGGVKS